MKKICFIIPCYHSSKTIEIVVDSIKKEFVAHPDYSYRIILSNDNLPDETYEVIKRLCHEDLNIIGISLSRNFGQQAARMAALPYIEGDYVVFMDDDGQHPSTAIFPLVRALEEGYDIAYAKFLKKHHSFLQKIGSRINSYMTIKLIGKPKDINVSSFFAVRMFVAEALKNYNTPFPYLLGYLLNITKNIVNVDAEHQPRIAGKTGYTLKKLFVLWVSGVTNFSVVPLRLSTAVGIILAILGFIFGIITIVRKILNPEIAAGYTGTMAALLFIGGMIMVMLGMLGEYVGRMYLAINNLPQYVVKEIINDVVKPEK